MTAHTKGPWRIQHLGAQTADLISGGTFMGLTGGSGAPDKYDADDAAEWEANAALIAAAPDLLEALKLLLAADLYADGEGLYAIVNTDTDDGAVAVSKARAAIAKATTP